MLRGPMVSVSEYVNEVDVWKHAKHVRIAAASQRRHEVESSQHAQQHSACLPVQVHITQSVQIFNT